MEVEFTNVLKIEKGPNTDLDPFWIMRTLLAQSLQEIHSFGHVVEVALNTQK